uniref:probable serine/threonine-protein kinase PBL3 n=1 Tax=Erigeron canadensis TaxID=72917 RepID=UPI001CB94E47|nr:probable serine/threonine-protein kinase PBL3 [Erigeron canadensis]
MLEEMDHPNLVRLIGYCLRGKELLLVHEFSENGSLEGHLLHGAAEKLPLVTKIKIAVGVARGLDFLHNTQEKTSKWLFEMHNILLDKDFNAKLSDFDVRKLVHGHTLEDHSLECYYHPWRNPCEPKDANFDHGVVLQELLSVLQIGYDDQVISKQMLFGSDIRLGLTKMLEKLEVDDNITEKDRTCRN